MGGEMDNYTVLLVLIMLFTMFIILSVVYFFGVVVCNIECQRQVKKLTGKKNIRCPVCNSKQVIAHKLPDGFEYDCVKCANTTWIYAKDGMVIEL